MAASRNKQPDLLAAVAACLADRLAAPQRVCVAFSGGCDSVVLLHLLSRLGLGERLSALHVHHGLSPNADAWAAFCQGFAARLGVECSVRRVTVDQDSGLGVEAAARNARYAVLAAYPSEVVCLAHHAGDQAETVLFNLLRGSGLTGAAGMQVSRDLQGKQLWRPLLAFARADLEAYARREGLAWIEDESNADLRYTRNYLRHAVIPVIEQRFPSAQFALAQAAAHFAEAEDLLADLAEADWSRVAEGETARLDALRGLSPARLKNLLRHRLRALGWRVPGARRLEAFVEQVLGAAADRHPRLDLPDGSMRLSRGRLSWQANGGARQ